jgi:prolipoprotein diacylglyceryltransferase
MAVGTGFYFGLCLTLIFVARFFIEFTKENQVSFEDGMALDMGQLLSIPFIVIGIACMVGGKWLKKLGAEK